MRRLAAKGTSSSHPHTTTPGSEELPPMCRERRCSVARPRWFEQLARSPPAKVIRVQSLAWSLRILHVGIVPDDVVGRLAFWRISRFSPPPFFIPVLLHTHLNHTHRLYV
ncbi:hypothetical protein PR048_002588 [Dryococelus australis]|uniref:Uncharacterized protein n=1 Tax=Dryococelus australis TaxID=614101 RepID=A0ABQ9IKN5_9NEOP|nr:hypothetical protein PR048_002588 [Dryococelus australis]